jgi:hypothetical protein
MSIYTPKPGTMKPVKEGDVWWVHDTHGQYDGPWATEGDCWHIIHNIEGVWEHGLAKWLEMQRPA